MRADTTVASLLLSLFTGATAVQGQASAPLQTLTKDAFVHPDTATPTGATTFTPTNSSNLFAAQMQSHITQDAQKTALQLYASQIDQIVEKAYTEYGYSKNDLGVSLAGFLETAWEISNGSFKLGTGDEQDKAKTKAAVRQMQNALLTSPTYKSLSDKNKQLLYDTCNFLMGDLVMNWQKAGSDSAKKALVQQNARKQVQSLFGVEATALTRRTDGMFVSAGGAVTGKSTAGAASNSASTTKKSAPPPVAKASTGPLPAASTHGAKIFIKYTFRPMGGMPFDQLILFPSGAAFTDVPSKPVSNFDEATLRTGLKPYDIGTWKQNGNTITLTFPGKKNDSVTTLRKVARGWYDGDGTPDADDAYNTYFPVIPLTPEQLKGAWKHENLTTMGSMGGGAPMVAAGSTGNRTFNSDGTFSGGTKSFASATTANMGDAFKSGGNVGTYGTNAKKAAGRWRLDGPLITMESNGQRTVALAYILPHWGKDGPPDILIDGDWWKRPDGK